MQSILDFFISNAQAQSNVATPPPGAGNFTLLFMLLIFVFFMYMTVWRPQNKRAKEHRELLNSLAKGDEIVTAGGILGKVTKLTDGYVTVTISENVEMTIQKSSVTSVLPKGTLKSI